MKIINTFVKSDCANVVFRFIVSAPTHMAMGRYESYEECTCTSVLLATFLSIPCNLEGIEIYL